VIVCFLGLGERGEAVSDRSRGGARGRVLCVCLCRGFVLEGLRGDGRSGEGKLGGPWNSRGRDI
jgi:hypothetical protein